MNWKKLGILILLIGGAVLFCAELYPVHAGPGAVLDPPLFPNGRLTYYANSPSGTNYPILNPATGTVVPASDSGTALRKFVDRLPGLGQSGCTVSVPAGTGTCNENALGQYIPVASPGSLLGADYYEIGLKDFRTKMHSDLPNPTDALGTGTKIRGYYQINGTDHSAQYLGPLILARKGTPIRLKFRNELGINGNGNLFIPVDTTVMGAGMGPDGVNAYTQNRSTIHLHGGFTPWISDGTPHQWITPAGESSTIYLKGLSQRNVPDMTSVDGEATFYYTNDQSARLMFYHDHSYGITRLNVYAGQAAGYLITDNYEEDLVAGTNVTGINPTSLKVIPDLGGIYHYGIPLIIQDKSFVPNNVGGVGAPYGQDVLWDTVNWGGYGELYFPHVYEPNQDAAEPTGLNIAGRWDYGPLVWPPSPASNPVLPQPSVVPESFMDTPLVNGTAYPFLPVEQKAYRFRILSVANDRTFNLQFYYAVDAATQTTKCDNAGVVGCTEVKMVPAIPRPACNSTAIPPVVTDCVCAAGAGNSPAGCFPSTWPTDGRDGGVPDPANVGPDIVQIGTEGGFLTAPVVIPSQPVTYDPGTGNIANKALFLMAAERADIVVDFSAVPVGSTLILYSDAPAAAPGGDPRYDYYTGNPDLTGVGGAPSTLAGYGPNTRTIMQFQVVAVTTPTSNNVLAVAGQAALAAAFNASQPAFIAPSGTYAKVSDTSMNINGVAVPFQGKSLNDGFEPVYGRMNNTLGTENLLGVGGPVPLTYIDAPTEIMKNGEVNIWKIMHNSVDAHPVHFHLFNVQVVNRIGFDGSIKPPEPNELGWRETVRMNPLEDVIVAMQPIVPTVPFEVTNSIRPIDVTMPPSGMNPSTNFGHEYVWHCHILGHEEFDLMRPMVINVDQLLFGANAGTGIWQWDMGSMTQLNSTVPASIASSGGTLYAVFTGYGLFKNDGTNWTQINTMEPADMVAGGNNLYATLTGFGLWKYDGSTWTMINSTEPADMVAAGNNLYATLAGFGLWKYDGTTWTQINSTEPANMVAAGNFLYTTLTGFGLWKYDGTTWTLINSTEPADMTAAPFSLYATFTGSGLWKYDGTTWTLINSMEPAIMDASGSVLYTDFTGYGVYKYEQGDWSNLSPTDPALMSAGF